MHTMTRYTLTDLDASAGKCQVCRNHVTHAWRQAEQVSIAGEWVEAGEAVGHLGCLELNQVMGSTYIGGPRWWLAQFGYRVKLTPRPGPLQFGAHREIAGPQGELVMRDPSEAEMARLINQLMTEALTCAT